MRLLADGLAACFADRPGIRILGAVNDLASLRSILVSSQPEIVLVDVTHGLEFLELKRTQPDPHPTAGRLTFPNEVTHWWDASQLYGSNQQTEDRLRTGSDGKLVADGKLYLPEGYLPISPITGIEDSGFTRNWWVGLSMMHQLFVQEHNSIAEMLKAKYPDKDDQWLYDKARLINAALMAKIHTVEWTPAIIANPVTIANRPRI